MSDTKDLTQEEFDAQQKAEAEKQNLKGDNAVPERRPIASQQQNSSEISELTQKQIENGDFDPMGKEAYEKAERDPTKASLKKEQVESLKPGDRVKVIDKDSEYVGSQGAVLSVTYDGEEERLKSVSGIPSVANFAKVASLTIRTRGGSHALVNLEPDQVERVDVLGIGSSVE